MLINMPQKALDSLTHAQKERLAFIDFNLQHFGQVARADLIQRFKTGLAASTRDLTSYRELAPTCNCFIKPKSITELTPLNQYLTITLKLY